MIPSTILSLKEKKHIILHVVNSITRHWQILLFQFLILGKYFSTLKNFPMQVHESLNIKLIRRQKSKANCTTVITAIYPIESNLKFQIELPNLVTESTHIFLESDRCYRRGHSRVESCFAEHGIKRQAVPEIPVR